MGQTESLFGGEPQHPSQAVPAWFLETVHRLCREHTGRKLAVSVGAELRKLLATPRWLSAQHQEPGGADYRQHILYVSADGAFSVVALVWAPGQATVIHDHVSWCVVGVYRGIERETRYRLFSKGGDPLLVQEESRLARAGEVAVLIPPDEDIHRVSCAGEALAVSIHVYGADIGRLGTSINHRFEEVPVYTAVPVGAESVRWRELYGG